MGLQKVSKGTIKGKAITQLQNIRCHIVTGDAAATNIAVTGIRKGDTIISSSNLTDLTDPIVAATKAFKGTIATGINTVVEATTAGVAGNLLTIALLGDAILNVRIENDGKNFLIRYNSGVSTVAQVETAITALIGVDDLIGVKTVDAIGGILTAPASDSAIQALTGGQDAYIEKAVATSDGYIQFPHVVTTAKKLQVMYIPSVV